MAKEKSDGLEKKKLEVQKKATERLCTFFKLGNLLFGQKEPPYNINELKDDCEFCKPAKELAEELGIDWQNMTHEESNRIMLSLLDDYFNDINVDGEYKFKMQVTAELKEKK